MKPIPWRELLAAAGFPSYAEYLDSDHWKAFRKAHLRWGWNRKCCVCRRQPVHLHHRTYRRLGAETPEDVVSLCGGCHEQLHKEGESSPLSLPAFTAQFIEENRVPAPSPPRPRPMRKKKRVEILRRERKKARKEKKRLRDKRVFGGNWVMRGGRAVYSP